MQTSWALPTEWDDEVDVVVVGTGAGGLTAALVAAVEGAETLLIEKTDLIGGTTAVSGGGFWIPLNHHMAEVGVSDSRDEALAYARACAGAGAEDEILVALVDHGHEMVRYLEDRAGLPPFRPWPPVGTSVDYRSWLPGAKHGGRTLESARFPLDALGSWASLVRTGPQSRAIGDRMNFFLRRLHAGAPMPPRPPRPGYGPDAPLVDVAGGTALVGQLLKALLARDVPIRTGCPVSELLLEDGRVIGLRTGPEGAGRALRARRGVVMATGGFGGSEQLRRLWLRRPVSETCEIDANQGDGHLLGVAAGAQLANIGDAWWMPRTAIGEDAEGRLSIGGTREDRSLPHTVVVNGLGQRFVNESINYYDFCAAFGSGRDPANVPAWLLFDSQGRRKYAALAAKVPDGPTPAWVTTADTVEELAVALRIDPAALGATLSRFNAYARAGVDEEFDRGASAWDIAFGDDAQQPNPSLGTVEEGPFFAVEVLPGALATKGGLRVNDHGEVLRSADGQPLPGLYATGNCSSAAIPDSYAGAGATIGAAMTFAYIIGQRLTSG